MTIGEFKAFLDGMDISDAPTKSQWKRIVEKVEKLEVLSLPLITPHIQPNLPPFFPDTNPYPYTTTPIITC